MAQFNVRASDGSERASPAAVTRAVASSPSRWPSPATQPTISVRARMKRGHNRRKAATSFFAAPLTPASRSWSMTKAGWMAQVSAPRSTTR